MNKSFAQKMVRSLVLFGVPLVFLVMLNLLTDVFKPRTVEVAIEDVPTPPSDFPEFGIGGPEQSASDTKEVDLYRDFSFTRPINTQNIIAESKIIRAKGRLASADLVVRASATALSKDANRCHTVYFYIDTADTGGHLGAVKKDNKIINGCFNNDETFDARFNLVQLPLSSEPNGSKIVDVLSIIADQRKHYVGAFVATGYYGSLDEMKIEYSCYPDEDCFIEVVSR